MLILLSNDDGIMAPGLQSLREALLEFAEIVVVAPDRERSAAGHSITVHYPIRVDEFCFTDGMGKGWVVDGTPADSVKLAISALMTTPPDLVIAGINRGSNVGTDVLYSGTVSAAMEGTILGIPSLAVSLSSYDTNADYSVAVDFTKRFCRLLQRGRLNPEMLLNINIPAVTKEMIQGILITRLGVRRYVDVFSERKDPRGRTYYWLAGDIVDEDQAADTDVMALKNNYVSVTPIHYDLTDHALRAQLHQSFPSFERFWAD